MKKKGKALAGMLLVAILAAAYTMPKMVQSSIPSSYYITPSRQTYENIINCTGTIQAQRVQSVYLEAPIVAAEVRVEIGDAVEAGQALILLDRERTEALAGQVIDDIVQDFAAGASIGSTGVDWSALAAMYGLTTVVNGAGEIDYSSLESLLGSNSGVTGDKVSMAPGSDIISAPISGVVTEVSIAPGVPAGAGKAVLTIADTASFKVMASVGEADIAKISVGDEATVRGVAFSGRSYTGTVTKIYPTARKMLSGTATETVVDVEIVLYGADENLKSGFSAKVEIAGDEDTNLLTVPYEAIRQDDNNDEYVFVYEEGRVQKALVVTGQEMTNEVQVLSGLSEDSIVIYNPGNSIQEGGMIHIKGRADVY